MEEGAKTKMLHWHKDVCAEATCRCGKSSVALLIDWLTFDAGAGFPNYARWRRGSKAKAGTNKIGIAGEISFDLLKHGLHRSDKSVKAKIEELETKYGNVLDKYGSGIDEDDTILGDVLKLCPHYNEIKGVLGSRPPARPVLCSSNEDETPVTMASLSRFAVDDDNNDDDTEHNDSDGGDAAGKEPAEEPRGDEDAASPRPQPPPRDEGSPPRSVLASSARTPSSNSSEKGREKPSDSTHMTRAPDSASKPPAKKIKLDSARKTPKCIAEGMAYGFQDMSAVTKGAIERMFESRSAELEYKKTKDKRELAAKMTKDQVELEYRKLELEMKKSELEMKKSDAIEKTRSLRHAEMMQEAALMHKMGFSKEEVMDYIRSNRQDISRPNSTYRV